VPIHLDAATGDYAGACLLPGDPRRAEDLAERFLTDVRRVNAVRGLLGFTGRFEGHPVSIQATGMGCASAAIVAEELVQLGVGSLLRIGTSGGLQRDLALGDLVLGLAATPACGVVHAYTSGEPHAPTASWELARRVADAAAGLGAGLRAGPVVSSDTFYDPDPERHRRWSARGILAVEMEAAALFTIAGIRGVEAGCLLVVSDLVLDPPYERIADDLLAASVARMAEVALRAVTRAEPASAG
jgi:DeoD family purine-nucleoside phosphorylase